MAQHPLCDPLRWLDAPLAYELEDVQEILPHRFEMALLHGVVHHDAEQMLGIGIHDSKDTDFWVRGHVPGRPIMPGVVLVEMSAQLCAFVSSFAMEQGDDKIFGFGGLDKVRFRGQVPPGSRLVLASKITRHRPGFAYFQNQIFLGTTMVYEGELLGASI